MTYADIVKTLQLNVRFLDDHLPIAARRLREAALALNGQTPGVCPSELNDCIRWANNVALLGSTSHSLVDARRAAKSAYGTERAPETIVSASVLRYLLVEWIAGLLSRDDVSLDKEQLALLAADAKAVLAGMDGIDWMQLSAKTRTRLGLHRREAA